MITIVPFVPQRHAEFTKAIVKVNFSEGMKGIVAENQYHLPVAVVLLEQWTTNSVTAHIANLSPIALRKLLPEAFNYVFNTCDRKMMWGACPSDNEKAVKLNTHMGFNEVARIKDYYSDGVDSVIFRMNKEECRFLPEVVVKKESEAA